MTREEAIKYFKRHLDLYCVDGISREAEEMAIQSLSQEPTVTSTDEPMTIIYPTIVCDDAISREDALMCLTGMFKLPLNYNPEDLIALFSKRIKALPSVTQKSETVTEFADRCRECGARYGKLLKQRSGKWERHYIRPNVYKDLLWYCSACGIGCGYNNAFMFDYCPNCGAKMESGDK